MAGSYLAIEQKLAVLYQKALLLSHDIDHRSDRLTFNETIYT